MEVGWKWSLQQMKQCPVQTWSSLWRALGLFFVLEIPRFLVTQWSPSTEEFQWCLLQTWSEFSTIRIIEHGTLVYLRWRDNDYEVSALVSFLFHNSLSCPWNSSYKVLLFLMGFFSKATKIFLSLFLA